MPRAAGRAIASVALLCAGLLIANIAGAIVDIVTASLGLDMLGADAPGGVVLGLVEGVFGCVLGGAWIEGLFGAAHAKHAIRWATGLLMALALLYAGLAIAEGSGSELLDWEEIGWLVELAAAFATSFLVAAAVRGDRPAATPPGHPEP